MAFVQFLDLSGSDEAESLAQALHGQIGPVGGGEESVGRARRLQPGDQCGGNASSTAVRMYCDHPQKSVAMKEPV